MAKENWKTTLFEQRTIIIIGITIISYLASAWTPFYVYKKGCFFLGFLLLALGMGFRILSIGFGKPKTSGRGRKLKAEELNVSGPYAWVRNPIYLGNILAAWGLATMTGNLTFVIFLVVTLAFLFRLISQAEESFLEERFGEEYSRYKSLVPSFIPSLKRNPYKDLPWGKFNLKRVVRREQDTIYLLLSLSMVVSIYRGYLPLIHGTGLLILITFTWILLKLERKGATWKDWGWVHPGGETSNSPLFPYIMAFLIGLATGSLLFLIESDPFLTLLSKWL